MRSKIKTGLIALFATIMLFQNPVNIMAITTEFMVPDVAANRNMNNVLYASPNNNLMVSKFSYGLVADVLNTSNLDSLISELSANSDPSQYSNSIVGIYTEGAALSDADVSTLASEGWTKVELYYERYMISGSVPSRGMHPIIETINDNSITETLTNAGFTAQVGMFKISDISMSEPLAIFYEPEFNFLRGTTTYIYKYIPDLKVFVAGPTAMYDGYDRSFMDMEGLHLADGDPNGTFVVLSQELPEDLVISSDQIQALRDQLQQKEESEEPKTEEVTESTEEENKNELVLSNDDDTVRWTFANGEPPENFTVEAAIKALDETEISVDFDYSGELPNNTEVTVKIPEGVVNYKDGDVLHLYYCNPESDEREYVSTGVYIDGEVTFDIYHCSEYIITSVKADGGLNWQNLIPIIIVGLVAFCGVGFATYSIVKKRKADQ